MAKAGSSGAPWQLVLEKVDQRCGYLLTSGLWADCSFVVGSETNQAVVPAHKLILAMASPVFEAMFYGVLKERYDPEVTIPDVQPEAFKALLQYIYTGNITITSIDMAWDLCYGAKKYMLPHLVNECNKYIFSVLDPRNACRAYEFASFFDEKQLMDKCLKIIGANTKMVLNDESFEDLELNTVITVFSLDNLNVDSELDLFNALARYAKAEQRTQEQISPLDDGEQRTQGQISPLDDGEQRIQGQISPLDDGEQRTQGQISPLDDGEQRTQGQISPLDDGAHSNNLETSKSDKKVLPSVKSSLQTSPAAELDSNPEVFTSELTIPSADKENLKEEEPTIHTALEKIRFLSLTAQEFGEGPASSSLLTKMESFAIFMNIVCKDSAEPMPPGFSECRDQRQPLRLVRALYSYTAQVGDELSFDKDDIIEIDGNTYFEGWSKGELRGETGYIPNDSVTKLY